MIHAEIRVKCQAFHGHVDWPTIFLAMPKAGQYIQGTYRHGYEKEEVLAVIKKVIHSHHEGKPHLILEIGNENEI